MSPLTKRLRHGMAERPTRKVYLCHPKSAEDKNEWS